MYTYRANHKLSVARLASRRLTCLSLLLRSQADGYRSRKQDETANTLSRPGSNVCALCTGAPKRLNPSGGLCSSCERKERHLGCEMRRWWKHRQEHASPGEIGCQARRPHRRDIGNGTHIKVAVRLLEEAHTPRTSRGEATRLGESEQASETKTGAGRQRENVGVLLRRPSAGTRRCELNALAFPRHRRGDTARKVERRTGTIDLLVTNSGVGRKREGPLAYSVWTVAKAKETRSFLALAALSPCSTPAKTRESAIYSVVSFGRSNQEELSQ